MLSFVMFNLQLKGQNSKKCVISIIVARVLLLVVAVGLFFALRNNENWYCMVFVTLDTTLTFILLL